MYTPSKPTKTTLSLNQTYVAESIEKKVFRMVNNTNNRNTKKHIQKHRDNNTGKSNRRYIHPNNNK